MVKEFEIHRMAQSEDIVERRKAVDELSNNFENFSDKNLVWNILIHLTKDVDYGIRKIAANSLGKVFPHISNKDIAWEYFSKLILNDKTNAQWEALTALKELFPYIPDKEKAWNDIHQLTHHEDSFIRSKSVSTVGTIFPYIPDTEKSWNDIHQLVQDRNGAVRSSVAEALGSAFPYFLDKKCAWNDLIILLQDINSDVRINAASSLNIAFINIINKKKAWYDLHQLTNSDKWYVRGDMASVIGAIFKHIPEKEIAVNDLYRLTYDKNCFVKLRVANVLGDIFPNIPRKEKAWECLQHLAKDNDRDVRVNAFYSLGRASIFKATEAKRKEIFKEELEISLEYFKKSTTGYNYNPASFCLPFYRSFYIITFKDSEAEIEKQEYLRQAKNAVSGSESKEILLKAVENLSYALKEAQNSQNLVELKHDLNVYIRYCDRAAKLLEASKDKAPGATKLIKRGLPIIDERIKQILAEIQRTARALCKQTQGTQFADLGTELNKAGQILTKVGNPIVLDKAINNMQIVLLAICAKMPEEEKGEACELLKQAKDEPYIEDRINLTNIVLSKISSNMGHIIIYTKELNMFKKTVMGGTGITAGGDVHISDVSGQVGIGQNITQTQILSASDKKELLDCLIQFQKEAAKLGIPEEDLSAINGDLYAAIKEIKKEEPDASKIKSRFESAIDTVKEVGDTIEKVSKWEWTGKILKIFGKFGLSIMV